MKTTGSDTTELVEDQDSPVLDDREALSLRHPGVPTTIEHLAAVPGTALQNIDARVQVVQTLRRASISNTHPSDWLLFKAPEDDFTRAYGYLQDAGCDRVRDLWGISVFNVSRPEKIAGTDPQTFTYIITGDGRCNITGQIVEGIEGGRSSQDDFCRDKTGVDLELAVRKAARANLDGNITRELSGLKAMPVAELARAWQGSGKTVDDCRLGRGFGSRNERLGAAPAKAPDCPPPICDVCGSTGVYRPGKDGRPAFYGCPKYASHKDKKWIVDADAWVKQQREEGHAS